MASRPMATIHVVTSRASVPLASLSSLSPRPTSTVATVWAYSHAALLLGIVGADHGQELATGRALFAAASARPRGRRCARQRSTFRQRRRTGRTATRAVPPIAHHKRSRRRHRGVIQRGEPKTSGHRSTPQERARHRSDRTEGLLFAAADAPPRRRRRSPRERRPLYYFSFAPPPQRREQLLRRRLGFPATPGGRARCVC